MADIAQIAARLGVAIEVAEKLLSRATVQHFPLGSTAISDVWYNSLTEVMWIKFRKVKEYPKYRFEEVPQNVVMGLLNASSAGNYYHSKIKGNYYSAEISGPGDDDLEIREMTFQLMR